MKFIEQLLSISVSRHEQRIGIQRDKINECTD